MPRRHGVTPHARLSREAAIAATHVDLGGKDEYVAQAVAKPADFSAPQELFPLKGASPMMT